MSRELILFPEAEEEAVEAADWYEQQQSGLGKEWLAEVDRLIERIGHGPEQFAVWQPAPTYRKAVFSRFPYVLFFTLSDERIEIVAIAHGRRKPGYWKHRSDRT